MTEKGLNTSVTASSKYLHELTAAVGVTDPDMAGVPAPSMLLTNELCEGVGVIEADAGVGGSGLSIEALVVCVTSA